MFWLLVACGVPEQSDSAAEIDVSVAPLTVSIQLDDQAMDCAHGDQTLYESMGFFYVVNDGAAYVQIDIGATHVLDDILQGDPPAESWMDVSVSDDTSRNLEPGGQMDVELFAMGRCDGTKEEAFDRVQVHVYEVEVLVAGEPTTVRGEIRLTPDA